MEASPTHCFAVKDLGSNTARLVIIDGVPAHWCRLVDQLREVVRLRQGMTEEGLNERAVARGFSTLRLTLTGDATRLWARGKGSATLQS